MAVPGRLAAVGLEGGAVMSAYRNPPVCPRCDEPMIRDEKGIAALTAVPGWACVNCVSLWDLSKLNGSRT